MRYSLDPSNLLRSEGLHFPANSPYYLAPPTDLQNFTLAPEATDLGAQHFTVAG